MKNEIELSYPFKNTSKWIKAKKDLINEVELDFIKGEYYPVRNDTTKITENTETIDETGHKHTLGNWERHFTLSTLKN